jgi:hypothetical protein
MRRRGRALRRRYGRAAACPTGSVVQTVLFPRESFNVSEARAWALKEGLHATKVDETAGYLRLRQLPLGGFRRLRTIPFGGSGIKAVVGWKTC